MKVKLTEAQYNLLTKYVNESRSAPVPTKLSGFFNKNKKTAFFTIVKLDNNKKESAYLFKYENIGGFFRITDSNPGTPTKLCSTDANSTTLDTMIFDNEFTLSFGSCSGKTLKLNNVVSIRLFDANKNMLDELKLDNTSSVEPNKLVDEYNENIKNLTNGNEVFFDSKKMYDGVVYNRASDKLEIELSLHGADKASSYLLIDFNRNHFYDQNGTIMFTALQKDPKTGTETEFTIPIKRFTHTTKNVNANDDDDIPIEKLSKSDEKLVKDGKKALKMIQQMPLLQQAFYKKPSFWNLFVAELTGKKAPGKGILPTLQIVGNFGQNEIANKLDAEFKTNKKILFTAYGKPINLTFTNSKNQKETFTIDTTKPMEVWLRDYQIGDSHFVLENRSKKFTIAVKNKTKIKDVYYCDVEKYTVSKDGRRTSQEINDVLLTFLRTSEGYKPKK